MKAARTDQGPSGAKRYLEVFREMRENLADNLITLSPNKPGVLDLIIIATFILRILRNIFRGLLQKERR